MSFGTVQSCQLKSRSLFSPGAKPIASARIASREIRARPSAPTSCRVSVPGALSNSRSLLSGSRSRKGGPESNRRAPAQLIERGFINGTHFPSVLFSFSYTAGLRDPFIEALQHIRALYKVETTDRWFRVTKDVPVLRLDHVTLGRMSPHVMEDASRGS